MKDEKMIETVKGFIPPKEYAMRVNETNTVYAAISEGSKVKTNNERFNAMLNGCNNPRKVLEALAAFLRKTESKAWMRFGGSGLKRELRALKGGEDHGG